MRKLILKMSVSLDGFVGGPNGEIDWMIRSLDAEVASWIVATLWEAGLHIMGRRTYHDMVAYWPTSTEPFAAPMNEIPKAVFTRKGAVAPMTPQLTTRALADTRRIRGGNGESNVAAASAHAGSWAQVRIATGDLVAEIARLKQEDGKPILAHGGAEFARNLAQHGLIDEYRLLVHPVALGAGLPLFAALPQPLPLKLVDTRAFTIGTLAHIYRPA